MFTVTLLWAALGIVAMLINPSGRIYFWLARSVWSKQILVLGGLPVNVRGTENVKKDQSYVLVVNHQSLLDIPVLYSSFPGSISFVAKKNLFYIPIFGWSLWSAGFIPVDRNGGKKARESLNKAAKRIRAGRSLVVFPEGTRSPDGKIHEFKAGAFIMAIEAKVPIVPVVIKGTYQAGSKSTLCVTPHSIEVIIGKPISTEHLTVKDRIELQREVRDIMIEYSGHNSESDSEQDCGTILC